MTGTCWPPACDSVHVQSPALVEVHAGTGALGGMPLGGRFRCVRPGSCRIQALRLPVPFLPSPWHLLFHCCSAFCFYGLDYSRDLICAESHSTCSLVSANFTEHNVLKPHACCITCENVLPLWGWVVFQCGICHGLFIQPSADGHLGHFHLLAVVNSAAQNIGVKIYFPARLLLLR